MLWPWHIVTSGSRSCSIFCLAIKFYLQSMLPISCFSRPESRRTWRSMYVCDYVRLCFAIRVAQKLPRRLTGRRGAMPVQGRRGCSFLGRQGKCQASVWCKSLSRRSSSCLAAGSRTARADGARAFVRRCSEKLRKKEQLSACSDSQRFKSLRLGDFKGL